MSETKHYKGSLIEIHPRMSVSLQDIARNILDERGIEISEYQMKYLYGDFVKILADELYDEYMVIDGRLFEMNKVELDLEEEVLNFDFDKSKNKFDFECKFYNGGTCLSEMLEVGYNRYYNKKE